ncbi:MAG: RagB/SusD family nutrient uptake outer membrane protein [Bacteroidales bacterium]|nr:RagB/SusD family nutrient uptake outer membrane protein [Bacteroidales bacterium]
MKRLIKYTALSILLSGGLVSCMDNLNVTPTDFYYPDNYFKDSAQIMNVLTGCYDALQGGNMFTGSNDGLQTIWNVTDEMYYGGAGTGPKVYNYTSAYPANYTMWKACYVGVQRANQLLYHLDEATMKDTTRTIIRGEVKFLRAFFHFVLVQNWGAVPLIDKPIVSVNNNFVAQTSEAELYDWIIKEMTDAEAMVADISAYSHAGRISKSAVQGMLARVCLFKAGYPCYDTSKYQLAYDWSKKVIDSGLHSLNPNYAQIFINTVQDKYDTRESIWELEFYNAGKADSKYKEYAPSLSVTMGTNQANSTIAYLVSSSFKARKGFFDKFEAEAVDSAILGSKDCRRNWAVGPYTYTTTAFTNNNAISNGTYLTMKYYANATSMANVYNRQPNKFNRQYSLISPTDSYQSNTGTNTIMLRYSDVLLMAAEAANELEGHQDEAIAWVNEVRNRAYGNLGGTRIDRIDVTNQGSGYANAKVFVTVTAADGSSTTTTTTSETIQPIVYNTGFVKGAPTVASATVTSGKITAVKLWDRGDVYATAPTVTIKSTVSTAGTGATAVAVMGKTFDHTLSAEATASRESLRQAIKDERARELCYEGWRRLDLKRWHDLVDVMRETYTEGLNSGITGPQLTYITIAGQSVSDAYYYLPIPASEMALNRLLVQNAGW